MHAFFNTHSHTSGTCLGPTAWKSLQQAENNWGKPNTHTHKHRFTHPATCVYATLIAALGENPHGCFYIVERGKEGEGVSWKWKRSVGKCERWGKVPGFGVCMSSVAEFATRKSKNSNWERVKKGFHQRLETRNLLHSMQIWKTNWVTKNGQRLTRHKWQLINSHFLEISGWNASFMPTV